MQRSRARTRSILLAALAAATGAVLALDVTGVVPGPLSGALSSDEFSDTRTAPVQPAAARPVPVLAPLSSVSAPVPSPAGVAAAVRPLLAQPSLGGRVGLSVVDVETGAVLVDGGAARSVTPASTTKLVTAATALQVLGPQTRLTTRAVLVPGEPTVTVVGAGDPTLLRQGRRGDGAASMASLAAITAQSLRTQGISRVQVAYDTSLFTGPEVAPQWPPTYVSSGEVSRVSALSVDGGKVAVDSLTRSPDPALAAARAFQAALRAQSITVIGAARPATAAADAVTVGQVSSPTITSLVSTMLTDSNNDIAEALGHLSGAKAVGEGSFVGGSRAAISTLGSLGIPTVGVRLFDASGLARENLIPPRVLTGLMVAAASPNQGVLRGVLTGMPVGGLGGTLEDRFDGPLTGSAAGDVRAKTGSLTGVSTLAGMVVDREGRQLAFAVMTDRVPAGAGRAAESAIDRIAARLAACGCA